MQFVPGIAFGNIHFGMSVQDVQSIMGPDCIMETSEEDDLRLNYYDGRLIYVFYQEYDFDLTGISIQRASVSIEYAGHDLFSMNYGELMEIFLAEGNISDHAFSYYEDAGEMESVEFESMGITLYFDVNQNLMEVNIFELVTDEDEDEFWDED